MSTAASQQAIGALKLVELHLDHPTVFSKGTLRGACREAIERLQANRLHAEDLGRLYAELVRITPRGHLPYVSVTPADPAPFAAIIVNAAGAIVTQQRAKSIDGLVQIIALRFPAEVQP